jgi:hypothetical protein
MSSDGRGRAPTEQPKLYRATPRGTIQVTDVDRARHAMWLAGKSCRAIAAELGLSKCSVERSVEKVEDAQADERNRRRA